MNDLQNSIFEAMRLISENTSNNSEKTITIKCQIKEVIDAGVGIYLVQYLNNSFTVYSSNANIKYNIGTNVYVLVPDGDFSQEKIIIGAITPSINNYTIGDFDKYYDISDNFFKEQREEIELSSYDTLNPNQKKINLKNTNDIKTVLSGYFNNYNNFEFSFKAKTKLHIDQQVNGNYGATLVIPMIEESADGSGTKSIEKKFTLDIGNMIGNPYGLEEWTPQVMNFSIDTSQYSYDNNKLPYITYFCYNFNQDSEKRDIKDIFLKDFSFKVVEAFNEKDFTGYKLTLKASDGEYFLTNQKNTDKEITPTLRVNGNKTSLRNKSHYWFKENASVDYEHENYVKYGGIGWECINLKENISTTEDGVKIFDYNTKQYSIKINELDVTAPQVRYKCVIILNKDSQVAGTSDTIVSSIITLRNLNKNNIIDLYPTNGSNNFIKNVGYIELTVDSFIEGVNKNNKENIKYIWQRFDKDNKLIEENNIFITEELNTVFEKNKKDWLRTKVKYPANLVNESNIIKCSLFNIENGKEIFVGSDTISIFVENKIGYRLVIENGNKIFKYDADGDSPAIEAYDGPLSSKIQGIETLKYKIYKPDGVELTKDEYARCKYTWMYPKKDSMIVRPQEFTTEDEDYYYYEGQGNDSIQNPYGIQRKYNKFYTNNSIILKVNFQGILLNDIVNLYFIKDGDNGTNGTKYAAVITANDIPYGFLDEQGKECKVKFYYDGKQWWWYDHDKIQNIELAPRFNVVVYEDGEILKKEEYNVKYSMFDSTVTNPCFTINNTGTMTPVNFNFNEENIPCNIIQATVTITKKGNESSIKDHNTIIYAYYPIEISIANFYSELMMSLDGGFSHVLYGSDGLKPEWDSSKPFVCNLNAISESIRSDFEVTWRAENHIHIRDLGDNVDKYNSIKTLAPDEKYNDGNSKNFVMATISLSEAKANLYQTEKTNANNSIANNNKEKNALKLLKDNLYSTDKGIVPRFNEVDWNALIHAFNLPLVDINTGEVKFSYINTKNFMYIDLNKVKDSLEKIKQYSKIKQPSKGQQSILDFFKGEYEKLENKIISAYNALETHSVYKIVTDLNEIYIDFASNSNFVSAFGIESAYYIEDILNILNSYVISYNSLAIDFKNNYSHTKFNEMIYDLDNYYTELDTLGKNVGNSIDTLKENYLSYVNEFKASSSENEMKNIILKIKENCFEQNKLNNDIDNQIKIRDEKNIELNNKIKNIDKALSLRNQKIYHIRPIILLLNRYEMSHINEWDGNKIYTGEDDTFLLAPQVGAGKKENDNSFTGIVMGLRNIKNRSTSQVGLFGYHQGIQSLFLNAENGSAIFGKAYDSTGKNVGGQIIIDPTVRNEDKDETGKIINTKGRALLYSGTYYKNYDIDGLPISYNNYNESGLGMLIDLSAPNIKWGNGNFEVNEDGHITAKGGGTIAGWKISDETLKSINDKITLDSTNNDGKIYSHNHNTLNSREKGFYLSQDGISIGDSLLFVENDKNLKIGKISGSKYWTVNGTSNDSYISYNTTLFNSTNLESIEEYKINGNSKEIYIGTDGIRLGNKFAVDDDGNLVAKNLIAKDGGSIGGWYISGKTLKSINNKITLDPINNDGKIYSHNHSTLNNRAEGFYLSKDGISIGDSLLFTEEDKNLKIGKISSSKCWTINGSSDNSFIACGTDSFNKNSGSVYLGTDGISLGKDKFYVNKDGYLVSKDGTIGGWTISSNTLSASDITISSDGELKGGTSYTWSIIKDGTATFSNIKATGYIDATSGFIGGWSVTTDAINGGNVTLKKDGNISGATWSITNAGIATFNDIIITGNGSNNKIGGWTVDHNSIRKGSLGGNNSMWLSPSTDTSGTFGGRTTSGWCIGIGNTFGVHSDGSLYASSGKIGGWTITDTALAGNGFILTNTGQFILPNLDAIYFHDKEFSLQWFYDTDNDLYEKIEALTTRVSALDGI